ncbi:hydroxymethylglutaryl-CoA lyase [Acinetobacter guillouiae]|uniref:hydroxymethylglutaryl-CoA lyase n=1 Tax=Acinetobacter guillouiae TaxID=106649 RepID=UPI003AF943AA
MNDSIKIVEVGARDGLQNEKSVIQFNQRLEFLNLLVRSGFKAIEVGSCVSPRWVPQMDRSADLYAALEKPEQVDFSLLVPNMQGLEAAIQVGCKEIAIFTAASESFVQKNINCSIQQSIQRFEPIFEMAKHHEIKVRGYVSCVVDCPYEGAIAPKKVASIAKQLFDFGCYEISLGETIGTASPIRVRKLLQHCLDVLPAGRVAGHFHDTYGMALANISESLNWGLRIFDSSIAGLGGCPYAKGASGNVSTEDVVYLLEQSGFKTGIDISEMLKASNYITTVLQRDNKSHFVKAYTAKMLS